MVHSSHIGIILQGAQQYFFTFVLAALETIHIRKIDIGIGKKRFDLDRFFVIIFCLLQIVSSKCEQRQIQPGGAAPDSARRFGDLR